MGTSSFVYRTWKRKFEQHFSQLCYENTQYRIVLQEHTVYTVVLQEHMQSTLVL